MKVKKDVEPTAYRDAWTVAIPNLPIFPNKEITKFVQWMKTLDGFIGAHPQYPYGTLLFFESENQAKRAKNRIKQYGVNYVGENICKVGIPVD